MENGPEATISTGVLPPRAPPRPPRPPPLPPPRPDEDGVAPATAVEVAAALLLPLPLALLLPLASAPGSVLTATLSLGLRRCGITGLNVIREGPDTALAAADANPPREGTMLIVGRELGPPPGVGLLPALVLALRTFPNIGFGTGRAMGACGRRAAGGAASADPLEEDDVPEAWPASVAVGGTPSPAVLAFLPLPAVPLPLLIVRQGEAKRLGRCGGSNGELNDTRAQIF